MSDWKEVESQGIWKGKDDGDVLEGEIVEINTEGNFGTQYTIKKSDGTTISTPSHRVLQNRLNTLKKGQFVRIVYEGEEPPRLKGNNPTKLYRVYTK